MEFNIIASSYCKKLTFKRRKVLNNQAFSKSSLARCLRDIDFYSLDYLQLNDKKDELLTKTVRKAENLWDSSIDIIKVKLGKKTGYASKSFSEKLILRRCVDNLKNNFDIIFKHRNQITKELKVNLSDGTEYRIYKLDIKSFFESVDTNELMVILGDNDKLSVHTKKLIQQYLKYFNEIHQQGLPRGIEFSPILADIILKEFDQLISTHYEVYFYKRFVDDIVIITTMNEDKQTFLKLLSSQLKAANSNLRFNFEKQRIMDIKRLITPDPKLKTDEKIEFSFLGYKYKILNPWVKKDKKYWKRRTIEIGISEKKVKQFKTKIYQSFYDYLRTKDNALLIDRLTFLSTNRDMVSSKNKKIATGIFYNYCMIGKNVSDLQRIDTTLHQLVLSPKGRINNLIKTSIPIKLKKQVLKISFQRGYEKKIFKKYSLNRLSEITKIW